MKTEAELREIEGFRFYRDNRKGLCDAGGKTYEHIPGKGYQEVGVKSKPKTTTRTKKGNDAKST